MTLETTVYSASRGYGWSAIPSGLSLPALNRLYRFVSAVRGDFPDPLSVEVGLVSDGAAVAAFTIQNVDRWDSEQRASDYGAFAFFPLAQAAQIDFVDLLNHDFFWTPTHTPPASLVYEGPHSSSPTPATVVRLYQRTVCEVRDPHAIGALLAQFGTKSGRWVCLLKEGGVLKIERDAWR